MGEQTAITWTDGTVNFWKGCTKVSPACANCYMFRDAERYGFDAKAVTRLKGIWKDLLNPKRFLPGNRYFVSSWTDFFHEAADEWREEAWATMAKRPDVTFQVLTKRPERIKDNLPPGWPWPNVWMGFTAENQECFDRRWGYAQEIPAPLWFVSAEPLLESIDMSNGLLPYRCARCDARILARACPVCGSEGHLRNRIGLVITGGESGPKARPSHPNWFRSLRDQAVSAGVAFHFKQWGEWLPGQSDPHPLQTWGLAHWQDGKWGARRDGHLPHNPDKNYMVWYSDGAMHFGDQSSVLRSLRDVVAWAERVGLKASGRLLDGRIWDEMPKVNQG